MLPASPPLSPKSQQCLSATSMPGLQEAASSLQNFASLLFTVQRAFPFSLFCFALLYCLAPSQCLVSPIAAPSTDWSTDPQGPC